MGEYVREKLGCLVRVRSLEVYLVFTYLWLRVDLDDRVIVLALLKDVRVLAVGPESA